MGTSALQLIVPFASLEISSKLTLGAFVSMNTFSRVTLVELPVQSVALTVMSFFPSREGDIFAEAVLWRCDVLNGHFVPVP